MLKRFLSVILSVSFFKTSAFNFFSGLPPLQSLPNAVSNGLTPYAASWAETFGQLDFPKTFINYGITENILAKEQQQQEMTKKRQRAIYFTGAGIYLWWQLGVVKYMQEHWDRNQILDACIMGASAGSVSGTFLLLNTDLERAPKLAIEIAKEYDVFSKPTGLTGLCREMMYRWLDELIPNSSDETAIMAALKNLHVAVTPSLSSALLPTTPKLVKDFSSKSQLIEALLASCHIPFFMDGKVMTTYEKEPVIDGSFWYFLNKNRWTGLPFPEEMKPVLINNDQQQQQQMMMPIDGSLESTTGVPTGSGSVTVPGYDLQWIDYGDDEAFMATLQGSSFISLIEPETVFDMMEMGYNYMKREDHYARLAVKFDKKSTSQYLFARINDHYKKSVANNAAYLEKSLKQRKAPSEAFVPVPATNSGSIGEGNGGVGGFIGGIPRFAMEMKEKKLW